MTTEHAPPTTRREFLKLTGVSSLAVPILAGCSDIISSEPTEPTHSYAAVTGVWTAETDRRLHNWAELTFTTERAAVGETVGTAQLLTEQGGDVVCSGSLLTHHADPPTFWVDVDGGEFPCGTHRRYRFRHEPENGRLLWFLRRDNENQYSNAPILRRESR